MDATLGELKGMADNNNASLKRRRTSRTQKDDKMLPAKQKSSQGDN